MRLRVHMIARVTSGWGRFRRLGWVVPWWYRCWDWDLDWGMGLTQGGRMGERNKSLGRVLPLRVLFGRVSYNIRKAVKGVRGGGLRIGIGDLDTGNIYIVSTSLVVGGGAPYDARHLSIRSSVVNAMSFLCTAVLKQRLNTIFLSSLLPSSFAFPSPMNYYPLSLPAFNFAATSPTLISALGASCHGMKTSTNYRYPLTPPGTLIPSHHHRRGHT